MSTRKALWRALFPDLSTESGYRTGRERLVVLDILCVQKVQPIWNAVFPGDEGPKRMMKLALDVFFGKIEPVSANRQLATFYADVIDSRDYLPEHFPAMFVGLAATGIVSTALASDLPNPEDAIDDDDLDPDGLSASSAAAYAACGGLPGSEQMDADKLRAFWLWYLDEAVDRAIATVS